MARRGRMIGQGAPASQPARPPPPPTTSNQPGPAAPAARPVVVRTDSLNEIVIIAACLVDWQGLRETVRRYPADCFQVPQHRTLWEAMRAMHQQGLGWDPETLRQVSGGKADVDYALQIAEARPDVPPNLGHHLGVLAWDRARAEAARGPLPELLRAMEDPASPPERVQALGRQVAAALEGGRGAVQQLLHEPQQLLVELRRELDELRTGGGIVPYGIDGLDRWDHDDPSGQDLYRAGDLRIAVGARPGKITVLTASSGSAKSTLGTQIVLAQVNAGRRCAIGAWEPGACATLKQLAAQSLQMSRGRLERGAFTEEEQRAVEQEAERLAPYVRFMRNPRDVARSKGQEHNEEVLDLIETFLAECGAELFMADLWHMAFRFRDSESEEREALDRQQEMLQRLGCHGLLLAQQKLKELEARHNKRPARELIKGSSRWVDVADTILGNYLPGLWKDVPLDTLEVLVLKQRSGGRWPLAVEFTCNLDLGLVWNGRSVPVYSQEPVGDDAPPLDAFLAKGRGKGKRA